VHLPHSRSTQLEPRRKGNNNGNGRELFSLPPSWGCAPEKLAARLISQRARKRGVYYDPSLRLIAEKKKHLFLESGK
jgi:hypothetical protein